MTFDLVGLCLYMCFQGQQRPWQQHHSQASAWLWVVRSVHIQQLMFGPHVCILGLGWGYAWGFSGSHEEASRESVAYGQPCEIALHCKATQIVQQPQPLTVNPLRWAARCMRSLNMTLT